MDGLVCMVLDIGEVKDLISNGTCEVLIPVQFF